MPRTPTPEEEQFAKQIEDKIKARFHRKLKSHLKAETLEEVEDSYKIVTRATDSEYFTTESFHLATDLKVITLPDDTVKLWAESFANRIFEKLVGVLPKSENTIVLMITPLVFSVDYDLNAGNFRNHFSFRYLIDKLGTKEIPSNN
jgi:hypothetical protein